MKKTEITNNDIPYKKYRKKNAPMNQVYRCKPQDDKNMFVLYPNKSKFGYIVSNEEFALEFVMLDEKERSYEDEWHQRLGAAIHHLSKSGVNTSLNNLFKNLLNMSLYDKQAVKEIINNRYISETEKSKRYKPFYNKYPFAFYTYDSLNPDKICPHQEYFGTISECIVDEINFGDYITKNEQEKIKKSFNNKTGYMCMHCDNDMSISFNYNTDDNTAMYAKQVVKTGITKEYFVLNEKYAVLSNEADDIE